MAAAPKRLSDVLHKRGLKFAMQSLATKSAWHTEHLKDYLFDLDMKLRLESPQMPQGDGTLYVLQRILRERRKRLKAQKNGKETYEMNDIDIAEVLRIAKEKYSLTPHPYADAFPIMGEAGLKLFAEEIKAGIVSSKIKNWRGQCLDVNKLLACMIADVEPVFEEYSGEDTLFFVLNQNLHRQHLKTEQKAIIAAQFVTTAVGSNLRPAIAGRTEGYFTQEMAAIRFGVSVATIARAIKVFKKGDQAIIAAVRDGEESILGAMRRLGIAAEKKVKPKPEGVLELSFANDDMVKIRAAMQKAGEDDLNAYIQKVVLDAVQKDALDPVAAAAE